MVHGSRRSIIACCCGFDTLGDLSLGVLRSLASALETDFLSFLDACVASQQPCSLQHRTKILVGAYQRPGDSVANGPNLARNTATDDAHGHVEPISCSGQEQRLVPR